MKTLAFIISFLLAIGVVYAEPNMEAEEKASPDVFCPTTLFTDNSKCMDCHQMVNKNGVAKFGLKEIPLSAAFSGNPYDVEIIQERQGGPPVAYLEITGVGARKLREIADYLLWHPQIKKLIIELHSGGGSIMEAWRAIGIIKEMQLAGVHVETRVYGLAASAGAVLFVAGDTRLVNPNAEIMIHKVWTFTMFDIKTPDSSQDQADVLKHFQDNINSFLRERTNLSEDQLDNKIFKKDWWMTGAEAIELGIATGSL